MRPIQAIRTVKQLSLTRICKILMLKNNDTLYKKTAPNRSWEQFFCDYAIKSSLLSPIAKNKIE